MSAAGDGVAPAGAEPPGYESVWQVVAGVEGWMSHDQGLALFDAARACPGGGRIVEIGSFRGRSTIVLASAAAPDVEIVAIDPHAGNDRGPRELDGYAAEASADLTAFRANLERAGVAGRVTHLRMRSDEALDHVDKPIDVLYVDGAHRYGPASADVRDWAREVADGGMLLIHDAFSSIGVTGAIARNLLLGRRFRYVQRVRSLAVYRADLEPVWWARARNAARQFAQLPWFVRNLALKLALTLGLGRLLARAGRRAPEWPY